MNDDKVIIKDYEVIERTDICSEGFFLAEYIGNEDHDKYATGTIDRSRLSFGVEQYQSNLISNDYLEVVKVYHENIISKINEFKEMNADVSKTLFTGNQCDSLHNFPTLVGKIVVQSVKDLYPEFQNASQQIFLATGGFGCNKNSRGSAVYAVNLYNKEETRLERQDLIGVLKEECTPNWAKEQYEKIQAQKKRDKER